MVAAVLGDTGEEMPVCAWVDGQYGVSGVYLGVPARIGAGGVTSIVEMDLTDSEIKALRAAAEAVREKVGELEQIALD
jgi:malate dehydrogenase